ncbi:hypothetical protein [Methanobrevibacter sp.]|uniref:hypothetical protein n=1 Tax=Methanobrevibacter sp. TaxID=66852 RepID=UPI00389044A1
MDNKKIIVIGIIVLIIVVCAILVILTTVHYERIEITPNGTSMDVPANKTKFRGNIEGVKIWNWDSGALVTYNTHEGSGISQLTGLSFNALNELIKKGEMQNIDGLTCYIINADELLEIHLFDIIKVNYKGKLYCFPLANETSHDNIIICCNDRDIALHMAKSVRYKNVYPNDTYLENAISKVKNVTGDLQSKANSYANNTNLNDVKSSIGDKAGDLQSQANGYANNINLNGAKPTIEKMAGDLRSKIPI